MPNNFCSKRELNIRVAFSWNGSGSANALLRSPSASSGTISFRSWLRHMYSVYKSTSAGLPPNFFAMS